MDRNAERHYPTMSLDQIKALPVAEWAAPDCALFLWAADPLLPAALQVIQAWGFEYKTVGFYWCKLNQRAKHMSDYFIGLGYWTRANPEQCLLATRGKPRPKAKDVRRLVVAPRGGHSEKPFLIRRSIERLVAGPYLEMFARSSHPGWDAWGNETAKLDNTFDLFGWSL